MSWAKNLQIASFRGIAVDCLVIDDEFDHSIIEHRYPFVPGADIEDMGRGPRRIAVQAFFYGDTYEQAVTDFMAVLYQPGTGEFIHPVFGSLPTMQVARGSIHHEADNVDQAHVNFELIESTAGNPFFSLTTANTQAAAVGTLSQSARNASSNILGKVIAKVQSLNPLNQLSQLQAVMNAPIAALAQINNAIATSNALNILTYPISWANQMTALAGGIINSGISPSALLSGFNQAFSQLGGVLVGVPSALSNPNFPTAADAVSAVQVQIAVELACSACDAAATVLQSESVTPTLSPAAIESVTNSARTQTQACINAVMAAYPLQMAFPICEALKSSALAVQQAAQAIIVSRPPLVSRQVVVVAPLRLLAFSWYGDHTRALELQRLNNLANPNFLLASDNLVCYAS